MVLRTWVFGLGPLLQTQYKPVGRHCIRYHLSFFHFCLLRREKCSCYCGGVFFLTGECYIKSPSRKITGRFLAGHKSAGQGSHKIRPMRKKFGPFKFWTGKENIRENSSLHKGNIFPARKSLVSDIPARSRKSDWDFFTKWSEQTVLPTYITPELLSVSNFVGFATKRRCTQRKRYRMCMLLT